MAKSGFESNFVPQKTNFVQDTAPADPDKGDLWRDTSTDVLKQYDGSSWVSVQTRPDNESLIINNGLLEVARPSETIIGDFEDDNLGGWSSSNWRTQTTNGGAESTNTYTQRISTSSGQSDLTRNINLDDASTLSFYYAIGQQASYTGQSNDTLELIIDSQVLWSVSGGTKINWSKVEVPVSGISGDSNVVFRYDNNSNDSFETDIDRIKIKSSNTKVDDAGGV